jgi:hypothetical protein
MSWSIGYDTKWKRDIGYAVPAYCDHPGCNKLIDRGLSYVCGGEPYGGDRGCGLYFCAEHLIVHMKLPQLCERCSPRKKKSFNPKPDHPMWIEFKLLHDSWYKWREENKDEVYDMIDRMAKLKELAIPLDVISINDTVLIQDVTVIRKKCLNGRIGTVVDIRNINGHGNMYGIEFLTSSQTALLVMNMENQSTADIS